MGQTTEPITGKKEERERRYSHKHAHHIGSAALYCRPKRFRCRRPRSPSQTWLRKTQEDQQDRKYTPAQTGRLPLPEGGGI